MLHNIFLYIENNPLVIIMALFLLSALLGKTAQFLDALDKAQRILTRVENDILFMSRKNGGVTLDEKAALLKNGLSAITDSTPLTYPQAAAVIRRDEATGKLAVNKPALAVAVLKTGSGKEAQREFRDGIDYLKKFAKKLF